MKATKITPIVLSLLVVTPAFAGPAEDEVIAKMAATGFTVVVNEKSLFGRSRIIGQNKTEQWLVVLRSKTGQVLKDRRSPLPQKRREHTADGTGLSLGGDTE